MLKTITKIGNSQGLIFDSALRDLTGLKEGDEVNVTVHDRHLVFHADIQVLLQPLIA